MKESVVAFVEHNRIRHTFESADKFCFRKDRPMLWLQRVCFFVLRKLGAFGTQEVFEVERHVIEPGKFMDALFHQMHTVESFFNYRPKRILIGSAQYAELMHEAVSRYRYRRRGRMR